MSVFTLQMIASGGRPRPIGTIFDKQTFPDLSGLETSGGFTASAGKVAVAAGTGYMRAVTGTCLDRFKVVATYEILTVDTGNIGLQVGHMSLNGLSDFSLYAVFIDNGANAGKVAVYQKASNTFFYSASALSFTAGDIVTVALEKTRDSYIATATIGVASVSKTEPITYNVVTAPLNNTSKVAILASAGTYELSRLTYSSLDLKNIARLGVGDSISWGAWAGSAAARFGQIAFDGISAGPSDRSAEVLVHLHEAIHTIRPNKVFLMIGANEPGAGSTWQANAASIKSQLEAAGIICVLVAPTPWTSNDMSVFLTYLNATYPGEVIDCYTPLLGSGYSLNATYDSGDGLHLNAAGNALVASTIMADPLY